MAIVQSAQAIRSVTPSGDLLFWYQQNEPMGGLYRSVASTSLWAYRVVNERFPSLEKGPDSFQTPKPNTHVVVLTNDEDAFQKGEGALRRIGLGAQLLAERRIQEGPIGWNMIFIKVQDAPIKKREDISIN
jgi:hypothetical protein